jgi:MFS family permease
LTKETGKHHYTEYDSGPNPQKLGEKLWTSLSRPTRLLLTQPILQIMSLFMAWNFGILYFVLSTFSELYTSHYQQSTLVSSLHYLAIVIGYVLANQLGSIVMDKLWDRLKKQSADGNTVAPEYRVPLLVPGGLLIPIGLLWYGWAAEAHTHWIVPDIGALIFGCGFILSTNAMFAYILDAFGKYTASATAASNVLRMVFGFAFPIFAPAMYNSLHWGWANTTLALISLVFGLPAPLILWRYGEQIRAMGKPQW